MQGSIGSLFRIPWHSFRRNFFPPLDLSIGFEKRNQKHSPPRLLPAGGSHPTMQTVPCYASMFPMFRAMTEHTTSFSSTQDTVIENVLQPRQLPRHRVRISNLLPKARGNTIVLQDPRFVPWINSSDIESLTFELLCSTTSPVEITTISHHINHGSTTTEGWTKAAMLRPRRWHDQVHQASWQGRLH